MRRHAHEAIELDLSLRQSRSVWVTLALLLLPTAIWGALAIVGNLAAIALDPVNALWNILIGVVLVGADVAAFNRVYEATRRLKILHENPDANVHPLPAPFKTSLFGPYY